MAVIKRRTKDGYVKLTGFDETRNGKYNEAYEHRHEMAEFLGCPIPSNAVVHHRNRKRHKNGIENLLLLPDQSIHALLHGYMKAGKHGFVAAIELWALEEMKKLQTKNKVNPTSVDCVHKSIEEICESQKSISTPGHRISGKSKSYLQQYLSIKARYPGFIVFIMRGCYYEVFEGDAVKMKRNFGWKTYYNKMFELESTGTGIENLKVFENLKLERISYVIVDQVGDTKIHRIFDRAIVEVYDSAS